MTENPVHFRFESQPQGWSRVWIDVADRRVNALGDSMFDDLERTVDEIESRRADEVIVFQSAKRSSYIVGADLKQVASLGSEMKARDFLQRGQAIFERIRSLTQPTIAAIHGPCLGGGLEFALSCDYRVARDDPKTQLGLPETKLGLIPGWGGTQDLPRQIGLTAALKLLVTGESVNAVQAVQLGLINRKLAAKSFESEILEVADQAARRMIAKPRRTPWQRWLEKRLPFSWFIPKDALSNLTGPQRVAAETLLEVVRVGWPQDRQAGLTAERNQFFGLLSAPDVQGILAEFFKPREKA